MDIRTEDTKDVALFFNLFNEILQKVSGSPEYKFNPHYFLCNEGGANQDSLWRRFLQNNRYWLQVAF